MLDYVKKESSVHSLDARAKLALLAAFMLAQIFAPLPYAPLFFAATIAFYALARIDFLEVVLARKALLLLPLIPSLLRLLFEKGTVEIAGMAMPQGILNGCLNFVFLFSLLYTPLLFALTTAPSQVSLALRFYGMPKRWALIFSVAFVSVSYIQRKAERTLVAQRARGSSGNALALMLPILHSCFRRARTMACSMAARGFDADEA
ncbi:MAG: energy-coupling factor transporter transmembrane component T [Candidatus Micrarchaeota archaeon]|nr:energy-coupling factor transporter transmembrane component T [Candidatus Micrarchaeota archaeon]